MNVSRVCVDASFSVKLVLWETGSDQVAKQWDAWWRRNTEIVAPGLLWYELTSIIAKRRWRGDITDGEGATALEALLSLDLATIDGANLCRRAYELAEVFGHTAAYDAVYVSVAEREQCPLWTADGGIATACELVGIEAHLIS